jgi:hypothetical protein
VHEILIEIDIDSKILQRNEQLQEILIDSCLQEIEIEIDKELARPFLWTLFDCA